MLTDARCHCSPWSAIAGRRLTGVIHAIDTRCHCSLLCGITHRRLTGVIPAKDTRCHCWDLSFNTSLRRDVTAESSLELYTGDWADRCNTCHRHLGIHGCSCILSSLVSLGSSIHGKLRRMACGTCVCFFFAFYCAKTCLPGCIWGENKVTTRCFRMCYRNMHQVCIFVHASHTFMDWSAVRASLHQLQCSIMECIFVGSFHSEVGGSVCPTVHLLAAELVAH